jgi:inosine/xanthosine triphosphate pyrophosphatase family protein
LLDRKIEFSHRSKALDKFAKWYNNHIYEWNIYYLFSL